MKLDNSGLISLFLGQLESQREEERTAVAYGECTVLCGGCTVVQGRESRLNLKNQTHSWDNHGGEEQFAVELWGTIAFPV